MLICERGTFDIGMAWHGKGQPCGSPLLYYALACDCIALSS